MFYSIGNIFTREPRQAEQTDTRQAIQRHDPDFEQSAKQQGEDAAEEFGEDVAFVSVEALTIFLKNFVKEQAEKDQQGLTETPLADHSPALETLEQTPPQHPPQNTPAAKAANAYQTTSQVQKQEDVLIETTDAAQGPSLDLSTEDVRAINLLIDELNDLKNSRIETLRIERATSFLESLQAAVTQAKATL